MGLFDSIGNLFSGGGGINLGSGLGSLLGSYFGPVGTMVGGELGGMVGGALGSEKKPDPFMGLNPVMLAATGQAGALAPLAQLSGMGYGATSEQRQKDMLMSMLKKSEANKQAKDLMAGMGTDVTGGNKALSSNVLQTQNPWMREALSPAMPVENALGMQLLSMLGRGSL